jgi:cell division transport system permease protein
VVIGITLALFVLATFGIIIVHANKLGEVIRKNVEVQVYLHKSTSENQRNRIKQELSAKPFIAVDNTDNTIRFLSKENAAKSFIDDTGEDFFDILDNNPLHDAFLINIRPEYIENQKMKRVKSELEEINGVFEVHYPENLVTNLENNIQSAGLFLILLFSLFLFSSVILINNTIKLALFSQRFLIRSMQLVGAKPSFIQKPFLIRASFYGMLSGVLTCFLVLALTGYAYNEVSELKILYDPEKIMSVLGLVIFTGILIGLLSSYRAIKKYLNMSLDELY